MKTQRRKRRLAPRKIIVAAPTPTTTFSSDLLTPEEERELLTNSWDRNSELVSVLIRHFQNMRQFSPPREPWPMSQSFRDHRVGFAVPGSQAFSDDLMSRGLTWMSGWFHSWILNLLSQDPLDTAGNGRFARKVVVHCKHERARRLSTTPPHLLTQASDDDLIVNDDDMRRAIAAALTVQ